MRRSGDDPMDDFTRRSHQALGADNRDFTGLNGRDVKLRDTLSVNWERCHAFMPYG